MKKKRTTLTKNPIQNNQNIDITFQEWTEYGITLI